MGEEALVLALKRGAIKKAESTENKDNEEVKVVEE